MDEHDISLGRCLSRGWDVLTRNAGLTIGGYLLFSLIATACSQIPLGSVLGMFPLAGGLYMLFLGLLKGLNPEFPTLFAGFSSMDNWARWLGIGWLLFLYQLLAFLVCAVPGGLVVGLGIAAIACWHCIPAGVVLIVFGSLVTLIAYMAYAIRWAFVFLAGAEGATPSEAITASTELTEGLRFELFWIIFVLGLINLAGLLLCCVGTIFTSPLVECSVAALYLDVKRLKAQQVTVEQSGG